VMCCVIKIMFKKLNKVIYISKDYEIELYKTLSILACI
jgi:hypothetical protein